MFAGTLLGSNVHDDDPEPDCRLYTEKPVSLLELSVHVKLIALGYINELVAISAVGVVGDDDVLPLQPLAAV
ncbi:MAG: hypothetical protein A3F80_05070 [Candidatus Melainabacteria bacterium RIFCSPLOWO2_12_FULL_35_11]|nr:MAG: hypothetical protein A3F80_05070 [Candidatus Melainabacteria bacterium RIFCSPLOWO2_12_FULL_35_11]